MVMKRAAATLLALVLLCGLPGCGNDGGGKLTLDAVRAMVADKGEELTWRDFERYPSVETGSGLYILVYEIDADYRLMIGGVPDEKPVYIYLVSTEDIDRRVDVRYDDIDAFLALSK